MQQFFPPAPYPLELHEAETFEKLIAEAVHKKLPVDPNGHINRRHGNKLLRAAFAPPGDPHQSYLIKDENPLKKGRTKEFGYYCTCWRGKDESCKGCAKKRREEEDLRTRLWKPSAQTLAMMERSKEINRKKEELIEKDNTWTILKAKWVERQLTREWKVRVQRGHAARTQERGEELEESDLATNDDGDLPYSNDPVFD